MAELPEKPYYKIGEVARIAGVEPYVLRYWESEFKTIRPEKTRSNQRLYKRRDVEAVLAIKRLLYDEGYRIDGAKRRLRELAGEGEAATRVGPSGARDRGRNSADVTRLVGEVRRTLDELEKIVDEDEKS